MEAVAPFSDDKFKNINTQTHTYIYIGAIKDPLP